jgi:hypothetical protein
MARWLADYNAPALNAEHIIFGTRSEAESSVPSQSARSETLSFVMEDRGRR